MKQEKALEILKSGQNAFLTGSAGAGKTYTLNAYIKWLKEHKVPVAITASTGIAATHMNGITIHSWSGIGIKNAISPKDIENLKTKKYLIKGIQNTEILIIDEISMLHKNQLDMINAVLKGLKKNQKAFGGMQVVFAGDFFQLPPVTRTQEASRDKFAFMSQAWLEARPTVCYLTEQFRQSDNDLNEILDEIRKGAVKEESIEKLKSTSTNKHEIEPTKLFSHNADVDRLNEEELAKVENVTRLYKATKKGNTKLMEVFEKSLIVKDNLKLKVGAKVMFLKNNHDLGVMNGSLGRILDFVPDEEGVKWPLVQLSNKKKIIAEPEKWSINNETGTAIVSFEQVPLRLAWAITVHKSQGMTLEAAEIDLSKSFEAGQGYVALSRLQHLNGLKLLGINQTALKVDSLASKADLRFAELSLENEQLDQSELQKKFERHILLSGGTTDVKALKKHKAKVKGKEKKINTFEQTIALMKEGKTLEEIVEERGMAITTIQGHVLRIADDYKDVDISAYKPSGKTFSDISAKYAEIKSKAKEEDYSKDGRINSKLIYNAFKGRYDYGDIKLCFAFIEKK